MPPVIWVSTVLRNFTLRKTSLILFFYFAEVKKRVKFKDFENDPSVRIVWGDLTNYEDVLNAVTGSDYILHVGGMVLRQLTGTVQNT